MVRPPSGALTQCQMVKYQKGLYRRRSVLEGPWKEAR